MKTIESEVTLTTNDPNKVLSFSTLYLVQKHFTFRIKVKSGAFSGESAFCLSKSDLATFLDQLSELHTRLDGLVKISDYDSDAYIEFLALSNGHIQVSGQIGGSHQDQFLKFSFETDQTSLPQFIQSFGELNREADL